MVPPNKDPQRVCRRVWREMETGETVYIACVRKLVGDTLYIFSHYIADIFSLCEIVIFGRPDVGKNLAGEGKARHTGRLSTAGGMRPNWSMARLRLVRPPMTWFIIIDGELSSRNMSR